MYRGLLKYRTANTYLLTPPLPLKLLERTFKGMDLILMFFIDRNLP